MTTFQKSDMLTKFWVWKNYPNIGGRIKRVAQALGGGKKTVFDSTLYVLSGKKIPYVLHVGVNLKF